MKDQPLISVIVPIYKVEKYLDRCVESIVNQTYENLEIILVDDGSPDSCPQMCDSWAEKDNRIKVVHKENGGLSDARNVGMAVAKGEYIAFVDSDDWIEQNMISKLYDALISNGCDAASCRVNMVWDNGDKKPLSREIETKVFDNKVEAMSDLISGGLNYIIQTVWNKLYKAEIIKRIPFPRGRINEDEFWTWKVIANLNSIVCINSLVYNYYQREGSIMKGGVSFDPMPVLEAKVERQNYIQRNLSELKNIACVDLLYTCLFQAQRAKSLLSKEKNKYFYQHIKQIVRKYHPDKEYIKSLDIKKRIRISSLSNCFGFVVAVQSFIGIGKQSNV